MTVRTLGWTPTDIARRAQHEYHAQMYALKEWAAHTGHPRLYALGVPILPITALASFPCGKVLYDSNGYTAKLRHIRRRSLASPVIGMLIGTSFLWFIPGPTLIRLPIFMAILFISLAPAVGVIDFYNHRGARPLPATPFFLWEGLIDWHHYSQTPDSDRSSSAVIVHLAQRSEPIYGFAAADETRQLRLRDFYVRTGLHRVCTCSESSTACDPANDICRMVTNRAVHLHE